MDSQSVVGPNGRVKIAFYRNQVNEACSPESVDRAIRKEDVALIRHALQAYLPALDGPLVQATTRF